MSELPLHHNDQDRIVYPSLDQTSLFYPPTSLDTHSNHTSPPQSHKQPAIPDPQPRHSLSHHNVHHHNHHNHHREKRRSSQVSSNGRGSLSSSTMGSTSNAKVTPAHPAFPAAAFIVSPNVHPESMSDNQRMSWQDQREWMHEKQHMAIGKLALEPAPTTPRRHLSVVGTDYDDDDDDDSYDEPTDASDHENAFYILLRISFIVPVYSFLVALYTFADLIFLTVATPLRLCPPTAFFKPPNTLSTQLYQTLVPLHRRHRRLIYSPSPSQRRRERHPYHQSTSHPSSPSGHGPNSHSRHHHDSTQSNSPASDAAYYSIFWLIAVHLLSPVLIIPILFSAWISAFFWIFTMIMGNPDGTERRDDGRAAVLGVRNWWKAWLGRAKRRKKRERSSRSGGGGGGRRCRCSILFFNEVQ